MKKRTLRGCMKSVQQRIGNRLRTVLVPIKSKLPEQLVESLEELYEEISDHPELSFSTICSLAWGVYGVFFDLRRAISKRLRTFRKQLRRLEVYSAQNRFQPKASGPINRLRYSIHAAIKGKECRKSISERGLPEAFHYKIEGLRVQHASVIMIDGRCYDADWDSYVHIMNDAGIEFVFELHGLCPIVGDRHAIPDDDYVQILLWMHRHEQELSSAWYAHASPIVEWHGWNFIDRYRAYLERRQMQARLRAELLSFSSKYRRE